jgi:hypothetical protein
MTGSRGEMSKKQSGVGTTMGLLGEAKVAAGWIGWEEEGMDARARHLLQN